MARVWRFIEYDGTDEVGRVDVPVHRLSDAQAESAMKALAARHLSFEEVITSSLSRHRGGPARRNLLDVAKPNSPTPMFSVGENPHYTLRVVESDERKGDSHGH